MKLKLLPGTAGKFVLEPSNLGVEDRSRFKHIGSSENKASLDLVWFDSRQVHGGSLPCNCFLHAIAMDLNTTDPKLVAQRMHFHRIAGAKYSAHQCSRYDCAEALHGKTSVNREPGIALSGTWRQASCE